MVNKKALTALINSAVCDCLGKSRNAMLKNIKRATEAAKKKKVFDFPDIKEFSSEKLIVGEIKSPGARHSTHPTEKWYKFANYTKLERWANLT